MKVDKRHCKLDWPYIETYVVKKVIAKYPEINVHQWMSQTTSSIYVRLGYKDCARCVRFADHPSVKSSAHTILIARSTRNQKVLNDFEKVVKNLITHSTRTTELFTDSHK